MCQWEVKDGIPPGPATFLAFTVVRMCLTSCVRRVSKHWAEYGWSKAMLSVPFSKQAKKHFSSSASMVLLAVGASVLSLKLIMWSCVLGQWRRNDRQSSVCCQIWRLYYSLLEEIGPPLSSMVFLFGETWIWWLSNSWCKRAQEMCILLGCEWHWPQMVERKARMVVGIVVEWQKALATDERDMVVSAGKIRASGAGNITE